MCSYMVIFCHMYVNISPFVGAHGHTCTYMRPYRAYVAMYDHMWPIRGPHVWTYKVIYYPYYIYDPLSIRGY